MLNTVMKTIPKPAAGTVGKFWEIFVQETNAGKIVPPALIPQPYKDMKELAEESKNPITILPKILPPAKGASTGQKKSAENPYWDLPILSGTVDDTYKEQFGRVLLEDYVSDLIGYAFVFHVRKNKKLSNIGRIRKFQ